MLGKSYFTMEARKETIMMINDHESGQLIDIIIK